MVVGSHGRLARLLEDIHKLQIDELVEQVFRHILQLTVHLSPLQRHRVIFSGVGSLLVVTLVTLVRSVVVLCISLRSRDSRNCGQETDLNNKGSVKSFKPFLLTTIAILNIVLSVPNAK